MANQETNQETTETTVVVETPKEETTETPEVTTNTTVVVDQPPAPAEPPKPEEPKTSFNESALKEVKEILALQKDKLDLMMEKIEGIQTQYQAEVLPVVQEMRQTMELFQGLIGDVDSQIQKLAVVTQSLAILHEESKKK